MKMIKLAITMVLCGVLLVLTACSGGSKQELVVGIMSDLDSIPLVVAKQKGFMPENVRLDIYKSPLDRDSALFSGGMDGTISDVLAVALAKNGGFEVMITSKTNGRYGLLTYEKLDASQLAGKQLGLTLNTIIEYAMDCIIERSGGDPSLVEKVSVPKIPSRQELLLSGQIDAIGMPEPYVTAALEAGAYVLGTSSELDINPGIILFQKSALDNKKSEIKAFYAAYNKGVDYINSNPKENFMPEVIAEVGYPEAAINVELPAYTHATLPDSGEVSSAVAWLFNKGMIDAEYGYDELVTKNSF